MTGALTAWAALALICMCRPTGRSIRVVVSEPSSPRYSQPNALVPCPDLASVDLCPMR